MSTPLAIGAVAALAAAAELSRRGSRSSRMDTWASRAAAWKPKLPLETLRSLHQQGSDSVEPYSEQQYALDDFRNQLKRLVKLGRREEAQELAGNPLVLEFNDLRLDGVDLDKLDLSYTRLGLLLLQGCAIDNLNLSNTTVGTLLHIENCVLPGADLRGLFVEGEPSIYDTDLSGADLSPGNHPTSLQKVRIVGGSMAGADLTGANLSGSDLSGADLTGANLTWTDLSNSRLSEADLTDTTIDNTNMDKAFLAGAAGEVEGLFGRPLKILGKPRIGRFSNHNALKVARSRLSGMTYLELR
jgi:uncharacterized protein YjbI with pentapeptide repeats